MRSTVRSVPSGSGAAAADGPLAVAAAGVGPAGIGSAVGGPVCGWKQASVQPAAVAGAAGPVVGAATGTAPVGGRCSAHRSVACAQRVTNGQSPGGSVSSGIPPAVARTRRPSTSGTEASNARVYGWAGARSTFAAGPLSTTVPA